MSAVWKGNEGRRRRQVTSTQILWPSCELQPERDLRDMSPRGDLLSLYLLILWSLLEGLLDLGSDKLGRGQRLCLLGPVYLSRRGDGEETTSCSCRALEPDPARAAWTSSCGHIVVSLRLPRLDGSDDECRDDF